MSTAMDGRGAIPQWTLPDRLVKARTHAGMGQREIAEALDVSVRTINRYESGEPVKRGIVLGWALACGVDPDWLENGGGGGGGARSPRPATTRYAPQLRIAA